MITPLHFSLGNRARSYLKKQTNKQIKEKRKKIKENGKNARNSRKMAIFTSMVFSLDCTFKSLVNFKRLILGSASQRF